MKFKELIVAAAVNALLLNIFLSFKSRIIKSEMMKVYKSQSENEH